jgi:hypothetical protein
MFLLIFLLIFGSSIAVFSQQEGYHHRSEHGRSEWVYVGPHDCKSGKQSDGSYAIPFNGKIYFKQVNKDGTVNKVTCDKE